MTSHGLWIGQDLCGPAVGGHVQWNPTHQIHRPVRQLCGRSRGVDITRNPALESSACHDKLMFFRNMPCFSCCVESHDLGVEDNMLRNILRD